MRWLMFAILIVSLPSVMGVTIHGTVYDFELNTVSSAIVNINSSPQQKMVSKSGAYSFTVPPGRYTLYARDSREDIEVQEELVAKQDGTYVLDLILVPALEGDAELLEEVPDVPQVEEIVQDRPITPWLAWLAVFFVLGYIVYRVSRGPNNIVTKEVVKEVREVVVSADLERIVEFVESEGGRATQKAIRSNFPYSEAKISLMIDELEEKGILKRVRKGRGNLIIRA